jgi:hypothetical protein
MKDLPIWIQHDKKRDLPLFYLDGANIRDIPSDNSDNPDRLIVYLPWSCYDNYDLRYPTVYLCDAFWDYPIAYGIYPQLLYDKAVTEYILVGLAYGGKNPDVDTLRKRDLAPPSTGSDYLERLEKTIIPFIESEYPADGKFRCISGTSVAGNFAIGSLFSKPDLFDAAIALSPTVKTFDGWLFDEEENFYKKNKKVGSSILGLGPKFDKRLFVAVGDKDNPQVINSAKEFDKVLDSRKYRYLDKQFRVIDGEKHGGVKPEGLNRGLRHTFGPFIEE